MAPENESAASSVPGIISGSIPKRSRTPSTKSARFCASLEALVAQNLKLSTPLRRRMVTNSSIPAKVRINAASEKFLVRSIPSPRRTTRISR